MKEIAPGVFEDFEGTPWITDPAKHSTEDLLRLANNPWHLAFLKRWRGTERIKGSRLLREIESRGMLESLA